MLNRRLFEKLERGVCLPSIGEYHLEFCVLSRAINVVFREIGGATMPQQPVGPAKDVQADDTRSQEAKVVSTVGVCTLAGSSIRVSEVAASMLA
jgi:hypothetical protein